jgi:hypothetical protein
MRRASESIVRHPYEEYPQPAHRVTDDDGPQWWRDLHAEANSALILLPPELRRSGEIHRYESFIHPHDVHEIKMESYAARRDALSAFLQSARSILDSPAALR